MSVCSRPEPKLRWWSRSERLASAVAECTALSPDLANQDFEVLCVANGVEISRRFPGHGREHVREGVAEDVLTSGLIRPSSSMCVMPPAKALVVHYQWVRCPAVAGCQKSLPPYICMVRRSVSWLSRPQQSSVVKRKLVHGSRYSKLFKATAPCRALLLCFALSYCLMTRALIHREIVLQGLYVHVCLGSNAQPLQSCALC